jgi:pyridoxine 5-phosphate synthase
MIPRLGVNIDHVATLRQARSEDYPSVVQAATTALQAGADQITIHLREDRRHIQDTDVEAVSLVTKRFGRPLNLEMGANDEIVDIAVATSPNWVCLVPEKREEKTTEGGLDLLSDDNFLRIERVCQKMKDKVKDLKISLFVEANLETLKAAKELNIDAVEIHTGNYARSYLMGEDYSQDLDLYKESFEFCRQHGIGHHAGHGLTGESVLPLLLSRYFEEYNIGHWIVCQSIFDGMANVIGPLKEAFSQYPT